MLAWGSCIPVVLLHSQVYGILGEFPTSDYNLRMKVLFVCRANVGRSQMAAAFYNELDPGNAFSAGTIVDEPGQLLKDRPGAANAITAMQEEVIDIAHNRRRQLEPKGLSGYDRIVVLAEPESVPDWLSLAPNAEFWEVDDPKGQDMETTRKIRDHIRCLVDDLYDDQSDNKD